MHGTHKKQTLCKACHQLRQFTIDVFRSAMQTALKSFSANNAGPFVGKRLGFLREGIKPELDYLVP